ncbi:FKBP-type peptidyl-prolyl cis-trans isomerase [Pseudofrankia sp. DC12]|uniref:FKBP-type peptidyl-prolyl cis-trans isomerase n=1 Tax=Pseudofrankia sp. DC12 TaxID=683315 RepID=UPI0006979A59|nr:FKBP-type peptidyl-prolyl cis-trans isomerase [Pseudofrankia sp. DC12]
MFSPASVRSGGGGARTRTAVAASAATAVLAVAAVAGCSSTTAPDGTAAAPVPAPTVAVVPATVLPVVGNPTILTVKPAVGAGKGLPPTKLVVKDLVAGTGAPAASSATVTVNYVGVLWNDGKQFDASWDSGEPATFPLDQVIPGFAQGIAGSVSDAVTGMRVGGRRLIVIPPALGYGPRGGQGAIKADDTIVFVVDLLDVTAATNAPTTGATATGAANG